MRDVGERDEEEENGGEVVAESSKL